MQHTKHIRVTFLRQIEIHKIFQKSWIDYEFIYYLYSNFCGWVLPEILILSSDDITFWRLSLYQKIGIAATGVFVSAPTPAAAAEENRCEYVPATEAAEPAACPKSAENCRHSSKNIWNIITVFYI